MLPWAYLAVAAVFEVIFALGMKYADGFTRPLPSIVTIIGAVTGIGCLTLSLKTLPVSVAYPIWTAVGTLGTVILGSLLLNEPLTAVKFLSVLAIVAGIAGLKLGSG